MTLLRLLVAAVLTWIALRQSNPRAVGAIVAHADLQWTGAAVLLVLVDRALMAYRWLVLLRPIPPSVRPPFATLLRLFFVSTFLGTFLPASVGADAVRAYGLRQEKVAGTAAVASVLMDRLLGVLSIVLMAIAGLTMLGATSGASFAEPAIVVPLAVAAAISTLAALLVFSTRAAALATSVVAVGPSRRVREIGRRLIDAVTAYSAYHRGLANVLAGSVAVQALRILQAYFLGLALRIDAGLQIYLALIPIILLVMLLPITINGIGTSQAAFVWFFAPIGVPAAQAFALSVLFVALGIIGNLPGGLLYAAGGVTGRRQTISG